MAQANDSILVTPGTGATVATHLAAAKEHQVYTRADAAGHILGTKRSSYTNFQITTGAAANYIHWHLWNGDASLVVRVTSILHKHYLSTAFVGVPFEWYLERTTANPAVGSVNDWYSCDLANANSTGTAGIVIKRTPTTGAGSTVLRRWYTHSEETNVATLNAAALGGIDVVPSAMQPPYGSGLVLRPSQGVHAVQVTNSAQGKVDWDLCFTIE